MIETEGACVHHHLHLLHLSSCISAWFLGTVTAWPWWITSRKLCSSTWAHQSCTAHLSRTRGSLAPRAKLGSPLEVSCTTPVIPISHVFGWACSKFCYVSAPAALGHINLSERKASFVFSCVLLKQLKQLGK